MSNNTILVVDDDEVAVLVLQNVLELAGYSVIGTTNSLLALELFKQHQPFAVVLDIFMPDKDGIELIREIKDICSKTFIVAISANITYLSIIKSLGADVALSKIDVTDTVVDSIKNVNFAKP